MSGHSKWKNIMHKKEKTDAQKAKIFTKIGKEISMAVKQFGPDPVSNTKLRDLIAKAKSFNVPNDNIERIIKKASGNDGEQYEVVTYEGYGIGGVAIIVEATTDNRNRTTADVRHYFDKYGGNLGTTGCVSFLFEDKGVIIVDAEDVDEDRFMEDALDSGAEDFSKEGDVFEVLTDVNDLNAVKEAVAAKGYKIISAEPDKIPSTYVTLTDEEQKVKMQKLLDMLEDNDDVTNVWHNWDNEE
ncbi:MAG TPA: YebC/PmpR family DNA-binding transcriptional regulator [Bacillota bacterium]|nr:YebC/PmpR family DNA-binding transcriptional regulator [Bacillota bacterium]HOK69392.1 YebC/PmpR family DNA-binding transcriptional regulator [Bacillota bacterium]HPP85724.1 YebC/PmpR family DNA-binding transcriptional regulator [Bacillota bacterium]